MSTKVFPFIAAAFLVAGGACLDAAPAKIDVESGGVSFHIESPNTQDDNTMTVTPSGLGKSNKPVTRTIEGEVGDAELADLDGDGTKELLIYVFMPGTGHYADLVAYSTNGNQSLSEILVLPPRKKDLEGYGGRDEWKVVKGGILRSFPIYRENDPGAAPGGGMRKIKYTLRKGESAWELVPAGAEQK